MSLNSPPLGLQEVNEVGEARSVVRLQALSGGGFQLEPIEALSSVLLGEAKNGSYADLPYFLQDLCPQGFIGRQIARNLAERGIGFPPDPRFWHSQQITHFLREFGDDLPGHFRLANAAWQPFPCRAVEEQDYPHLADQAMQGAVPGSSAGGEQPKFTAYIGSRKTHVIVKFSSKANNDITQRWRAVMRSEHDAANVLRAYGFSAAKTRLLEAGGRLFLESERFDRVGAYGRKPMISLQAIDAEFVGFGADWSKVVRALFAEGLVNAEDVRSTEMLWQFGRQINNTDMHLGNLSFGIRGDKFTLLPVYDMCAMGFAPSLGGDLPSLEFAAPDIQAGSLLAEDVVLLREMAATFWKKAPFRSLSH